MSTAHIICGATGAGKTTYSLALAQKKQAQLFSIDDWMARLFWMDAPDPVTYQWALERVGRCQSQILEVCYPILARGGEVVLDLGFFKEAQRDMVRKALQAKGAEVCLHLLDVDVDTRCGGIKSLVEDRNARQGEAFRLEVTRGMFDFSERVV